MNLFDAFAVVFVVIAVLLGLRSGALPQIGGLVGALIGGGLAIVAVQLLEEPLTDVDPTVRPFLVLIGLFGAVIIGESIGSSIGVWLGSGLRKSVFSGVDRLGGGLIAGVQALLVLWLAGGLFALGPMPRLAQAAQTSTVVRTLNDTLPPPDELALELGRLLDGSGLPDVFVGFEPLPAPPVERPDDPEALAIAAVAEASTLRVAAGTCGLESTGSGFVVAPGYVLTNAHVIAGGRTIRVNSATGSVRRHAGRVRSGARRRAAARARSARAGPATRRRRTRNEGRRQPSWATRAAARCASSPRRSPTRTRPAGGTSIRPSTCAATSSRSARTSIAATAAVR